MPIATVNPATGATVETYQPLDDAAVEDCLLRAERAADAHRRTDFARRAELLRASADVLAGRRDSAARTMTLEMGKPISQALAEVDKCVKAMRWFAARGESLLADETPSAADVTDTGGAAAFVRYRPLGVVLAVMPWNFPLWQVVRFAAPALMAGNVGLLKHASNVPRTALLLQEVFEAGGFPAGCFQTLLIGSSQVEAIIRDPRVAAVTLTGSEPAGRSVAAIAADEVKKSVLELGGSDPYLVLPSADVAQAARVAVTARVQNNGQSCIAAKRFIVHAEVYQEFLDAFAGGMRALRVGDPLEEETQVGPLSSRDGRSTLEELVNDAVKQGATVVCGGRRPPGLDAGWYYEPTVLTGVTDRMRIHHEETFGPVAVVYRVGSLAEAVELANDTPFGLSSNAWTTDAEEQRVLTRDLRAGAIYFNGMTASHPALPFGGVKRSGFGRELAWLGIREFCNATTVWHGLPPA